MSSSLIVLAGAGHANIQVLKKLAMLESKRKPEVMLISDSSSASYSGMLPGYMFDKYTQEQISFNLWNLTTQAGFTFINDKLTSISPNENKIAFSSGRAPIQYDVLSLNIGINSKPITKLNDNLKTSKNILYLKPISKLIKAWTEMLQLIKDLPPQKIALVGGGPAGIETAVALSEKIKSLGRQDEITILHGTDYFLNRKMSHQILTELKSQNIEILFNHNVSSIEQHFDFSSNTNSNKDFGKINLNFIDRNQLTFDFMILATGAAAPEMIKSSGLATSLDGYLNVNSYLQSTSHSNVFGSGDCINFLERPLEKSGIFAVRQGQILTDNLLTFSKSKTNSNLIRYKPQKRFLKIIQISEQKALTWWGPFSFVSHFMLKVKTYIDFRFMKRFGTIPSQMKSEALPFEQSPFIENICGGCGSKVPETILKEVISELSKLYPNQIPESFEDSYPLPEKSSPLFATIDSLKGFIQDPFLFGKVSAMHALSDLWVGGLKPYAITLSLGHKQSFDGFQKANITQIMSGVLSVCQKHELKLINAHTFTTKEDQITITAFGEKTDRVLRKAGAEVNDLIVLSKPLGTGISLQALMAADIDLSSVESLIEVLTQENIIPHQLRSELHCATDVTGFGLIGHLAEILKASKVSAELDEMLIPTFNQTDIFIKKGYLSFLIKENKKSFERLIKKSSNEKLLDILWDPQTNGPILATIPEDKKNLLPSNWFVIGRIIEGKSHSVFLK